MTNIQRKLGRPAGELSPTELAEHKKLDAVRTHTCTQCGTIFAVEILKCPDCSAIARGYEAGPFSEYSYEAVKANSKKLSDRECPSPVSYPKISPSIAALPEASRISNVARRSRHWPFGNDYATKFVEWLGILVPGMPGRRNISRLESRLFPFLYALRAFAVLLLFFAVYSTVVGLGYGILTGVAFLVEKVFSWLCRSVSHVFLP